MMEAMEHQNIEWKESWRDEYLKWICGFANAQGGKIYIGTDNKGNVVGVANSKKLLEEIPNKVRDVLGIIVDVNLLSKNNADYIEIVVNPSSYPVNYNGEYHYRSGSTKQLLRGAALTEFLLSKTGLKWEAVPLDGVTANDLDKESFDIFRREALRTGRMSKEDLDMSNADLLDNLNLLNNGRLKRAAVLLFHRKPERWMTGCFIKIGRFGEGSDLLYQDELRGSFFIIADRVIELIYLKYLTATISYDKETRIETYPFPRDGIREAIYNALIHSNWADSIPIQIRIESDAMYISNSSLLAPGWTAQTLMERHRSNPYNPDIANAFFRAGYIEAWGRGIQKICEACKVHGTAMPEYTIYPQYTMLKFTALKNAQKTGLKEQNHQNEPLDELLDEPLDEPLGNAIICAIKLNPRVTYEELQTETQRSRSSIKRMIKKLTDQGLIERQGGKRFGYWKIVE